MITKQFVLACHQNNHPCGEIMRKPKPHRSVRKSAKDFVQDVSHLTDPNNKVSTDKYKMGLQSIHTDTVNRIISNYDVNAVLGTRPPDVASNENKLPRSTRSILSQLRSGKCKLLNSYMSRLDPEIADQCPACKGSPPDTAHLFNCPANPTQLATSTLWTDPIAAATFLKLDTG